MGVLVGMQAGVFLVMIVDHYSYWRGKRRR